MKESDVVAVQKIIGYAFRDKALLFRAFTHSSASADATKNYESLEFLGDSLLDFIVAKRLMTENPDAHEGALTERRASIVSQEPLDRAIERMDLAKYLTVGKGENLDVITSHTKVRSNLFEAIVGAIYMDSGNIEDAENFVLSKLRDHFDGSVKHEGTTDFKSKLQCVAARRKLPVEYVLLSAQGPSHKPTFRVEARVNGVPSGEGSGKTKKAAEQQAAKQALKTLETTKG